MVINISSFAYALRVGSKSLSQPLSQGHALELMAAAFGHNTLASYQTSQEESLDLTGVAHVVIAKDILNKRMAELGRQPGDVDLTALIEAILRQVFGPSVQLHHSEDSFLEALRTFIESRVETNVNVGSQLAMANGSPGEVYVPVELEFSDIPLGDYKAFELAGHIGIDQDLNRPFTGDRVAVQATVFLKRVGRVCVLAPDCSVNHAVLGIRSGWGDTNFNWKGNQSSWPGSDIGWRQDEGDYDDGEPPTQTRAEALASELGLTEAEAEHLTDANIESHESGDGVVYCHILDAESVTLPPALRAKLEAQFDDLRSIQLSANFHDNPDWREFL